MQNDYDNSIHFRHGDSDYEFYLTVKGETA